MIEFRKALALGGMVPAHRAAELCADAVPGGRRPQGARSRPARL